MSSVAVGFREGWCSLLRCLPAVRVRAERCVLANHWEKSFRAPCKLDVHRALLGAPSEGCTSGEKSSRLGWKCNR